MKVAAASLVLLLVSSGMSSPASAAPPKEEIQPIVITFDEYDFLGTPAHLGVAQIELPKNQKRRVLQGSRGWQHPRGTIVFMQGCGRDATRVALADKAGLIRPVSPCSAEFPTRQGARAFFDGARLSPDERRVAVEMYYYMMGSGYQYSTLVLDVASKRQVARFDGYHSPAWTPSGRLLVAGEGFYLANGSLSRLERIDRGQLNGPVANPDVHPSGKRIAFEYNQQIWEMNLDGGGLRMRVPGAVQLRFPVYSPDGDALAFLALQSNEFYERAIYFFDLTKDEVVRLDIGAHLGISTSVVPRGPLSWTSPTRR